MRPLNAGPAVPRRASVVVRECHNHDCAPATHKTEHHGHDKHICFGLKATGAVRPFLKQDLSAHLFSPADVDAARRSTRRSYRRSMMTPSQQRHTGEIERRTSCIAALNDAHALK
jgi:hypothetical protein